MSLYAELQQRKVIKVGAAYLVAGWLAVQAASIGFPAFEAPGWALRVFIFVVLLGFPVALVLAWMLVVTPQGVQVEKAPFGNKRILAIAAALAALAVGWYLRGMPATREPGEDLRSIAVLPFVNMSGEADNEYFSDGISEEILNVLARTPDLRVAARTSSFAYKGQAREIPDIARELEVRMVLEGSVRRQGERVRITAQLIDASNGFHLWSQTYDRELKDIFAIQDEIAQAIAKELDLKMGGAPGTGTAPQLATTPATDLVAYDLYLKGLTLWQARGAANLYEAERLFRAALARDPGFAKAWAGLALTHAVLPEWSKEKGETSYPIARDAAEHALALDPALPESYAVLGSIAAGENRILTGRAMFQRAIAIAPSYATALQWWGESLMYTGDLDEALEVTARAMALDPKSAVVRGAHVNALWQSGRDDEAVTICTAVLATSPEYMPCKLYDYSAAIVRRDYPLARRLLHALAQPRGAEAVQFADAMSTVLEAGPGGSAETDAVAARLAELPDGYFDDRVLTPLGDSDMVVWFIAVGRNDLAVQRIERMAETLPQLARWSMVDFHADPLRCDPGFRALAQRLGFEDKRAATQCDKGE